jgi:SAM-dependent methyltransferase
MSLLESNWLRAASRSVRVKHPRLYARLNSVRNRLLTRGSGLAAYQAKALRRFEATCLPRAAGMRVLEIGSDVDGKVLRRLASLGVAEAAGVNPAEEIWSGREGGRLVLGERAVLHQADARALPFDDTSFDALFSVATFEHILEFPKALAEMHRVLRPGGILYSHFGPIWSGCRGHHLRVRVGAREFRHFRPEANPLPDFCHLLMSREELRDALHDRVDGDCIEPIADWVFDDSGINRLFHCEYLENFAASPFELLSLRPERDPIDPQLARILRFRYSREREFAVTNVEVRLRK